MAACLVAQEIPAGTVLPIVLNSSLDARRDKPGQTITGKIMQHVPLPDGETIPRGAKVVGHIVGAQPASATSPSQLTLKFDYLEFKGKRVPITAHLRALASAFEVFEARMPTNAWADYGTTPSDWNTVQIGGAGVYRGNGEVVADGAVVGRATDYGAVTARLLAAPQRGCHGTSEREQALWKFSPSACGTYGLGDLRIVRTDNAAGEIVLESRDDMHVRGGSGWLLRVDSAGAALPSSP